MIKAGAGGFKFDPQEITNVSVGDIVTWEFYPPDHSVARAEYLSACVPYENTGKDKVGFWSETQLVNNTNEVCLSKSTYEDTDDVLIPV
jgi:plastocyanin